MTHIFNLSFTQGVFPKLLKRSVVVPIYKGGCHLDPSNYRPISILKIFSKLLEKLYYNRLMSFINYSNILNSNQFGFMKNKSTKLISANVLSCIFNKINNNKKTMFTLLDLKKACDIINHELLLIKLKHYGIRGLHLFWLNSYLSNRSQSVKVSDCFSKYQFVSAGVPQSSILGPILFNLFINDLFQSNFPHCEIHLYADDTAIIFSADSDSDLQIFVDDYFFKYSVWCLQNCIVVNLVKSNFLSFNANNINIIFNGYHIIQTNVTKYLGLYIDNKLLWTHHVSYVTKQCCQRIGIFKKVLPNLPNFVLLLYNNAFIRSGFFTV